MKFIWFISAAMPPEQFEGSWLNIPKSFAPARAIRRWVRSLAAREAPPFFGGASRFSAVEELWLDPSGIDSVRDVMADLRSRLGKLLHPISDAQRSLFYLFEDTPVIDGDECLASPGVRQFALTRRKPGITHEDYVMHWRYIHAPLVHNSPVLSRYVQNRVVRDINLGPFHDACSELSFVDMEAVRRFCSSDAYLGEQVTEDAPKFVDLTTVLPVMLDRHWEMPR